MPPRKKDSGDPEPKQVQRAAKKKNTQKYIRNIRYVTAAVTLGTGRRIELKARGQRGDCAPVSPEEMHDEKFLGNYGLLFEVIEGDEATEIIAKQTTNQQAQHPALQQMRNALGESYTRGVVVEENFTDQGQKVAGINERGEITRFRAPGTVENPLPTPPEELSQEEYRDWVARQRATEGPEAGLAGMRVSIDPPQRND